MDELKYCRACLVTDVKMFSLETISNDSIGVVYTCLAQIPISESNQHVCFECARILQKFQEFKSKCQRAQKILNDIKIDSTQITKESIRDVDRKVHKLESTIILSPIVIHYESSDKEFTEIIKIELEENKELELNVKTEEENFIEVETKYDTNESLNKFKDEDYIDSIDDTVELTPLKRKTKPIKAPITKKRRVKTVEESDDECSDDEPLSVCMNKVAVTKPTKKKSSLHNGYFDDYATVVFLTPEDAKKEVLLRKETNNYKKSPFKCDLCYRGFEAKLAFENHAKKHSIEYGEYECEMCHLRFPKQGHLCKHKLACHRRKFCCKLCSYTCYCTYQAKTHVRLHKGKKYPCKHCGEVFSMPNSLLMHKRMKHIKESGGESVCELCGSTFGSPRGLYLHNMKLHRQDKNDKLGPECKDCGVHFSSELAWKRHLVLSTKHNLSNGCKFCGEIFPNMVELKIHLRTTHSRKQIERCRTIKVPVACPVCKKWLTTRLEYKKHVTSEHPHSNEAKRVVAEDLTPFVCEVCGQMFKKQCFLNYHQRKHTGERPYKCMECDKTFQLAGALSIHRSVHERKQYKCDMCARVFTFKSALNKHMKMHLNIRPHKCAICDKGFIHMCDLKLHIKYVHDKMPWPKKKNKKTSADDAQYLEYN